MPKKSKKSKQRRHQMKKSKKGQTRKQRPKSSSTSSWSDHAGPDVVIMNPSGIDVPLVGNGYRIVGPAQAMVDYAKPLLDKAESDEDFNKALTFAQLLWNFALIEDIEDRDLKKSEKLKKEINKLADDFDVLGTENIVDIMLKRFHLMFPEVGKVPSFHIRERVIDIEEYEPFDESTIHISEDKIAPTKKEIELTGALSKIYPGSDESRLSKWQDEILGCYVEWCVAKGVPDDRASDFAFLVSAYLNYLSGYHGETVSEDTTTYIVQEFMRTHFIRKTALPAQEKTMMPFALKLFMQYLDEKGIVSGAERVGRIVESEQSTFQNNLRLFTDPELEKKKILQFRKKKR